MSGLVFTAEDDDEVTFGDQKALHTLVVNCIIEVQLRND